MNVFLGIISILLIIILSPVILLAGFFILFGIVFYWMICMGVDSFSIKNAFETAGIISIIPLLFIFFGLINTLYYLFDKKQ